ncbi:MAG: ABC transporter permease [Flavobacteriales bacterium]|nr:ABC transporter permease [Flavobacteriales bacterium]
MSYIKNSINIVRSIALREVKTITHKPIFMYAMLIAPLFSLVFFLTLMGKGLPTKLPIAVIDDDNTATSRNVARQMDAFEQTDVVFRDVDFPSARILLQKGDIYGIMVIPKDFEKDVSNGSQPKISIYTNNSFLIAGSLLYKDMRMMASLSSGAAQLKVGQARGKTEDQILAQVQPIVIDTHPLGNPWLNYSVYLSNIILPGILGMLIFLCTVYSIGGEIKHQHAKEWLHMAGDSLPLALLGKLLPHTVIFYSVGLAILGALFGWSHFPMNSGLLPMMLLMFLFVVAAQCCGVFMIGVLPNMRLGLSFASLWGVLSFSISGFTFPVAAMHPTIAALSNLFPLRHYFLVYADQALNGLPLYYSAVELLALASFAILPVLVLKPLKFALLNVSYKM